MRACPACGKELPGEFPFCPFCAAPLAKTPSPALVRERKVISALFCDLVGFTASSESVDPEDVQARLAPYHARTSERIEAFGGTVEKFIGDAVMAVFGAPVAHEDDAERAVRAGLSILEGIEELNAADPTLGLAVRVGINTGEAVITVGARPERGEGLATGDVVNTAARIQGAAPIGGVAVGEGTYRATSRLFEYEPLPAADAKGKAEPLAMWRATAAIGRFGSDVIRSLTTPLVGRETDLALLRSLFDKVARDSEVQFVTVVGEPGVGKSRLVAELFAYIDAMPELVTWRQGRCLPYGDGIAFWALGEIVKAHAGIYETDSPEQVAEKLDAVLPEGEEKPWLRARLLPLAGVEGGQAPSREEQFTAWRRFLEAIAERDPAVLVVEDIHWADEAFLAFLEHVADWAHGVPLLVVCTARPELYQAHPTWGSGLGNQTAIRLGPLSDADTSKLVAGLLEQAALPGGTERLLLERAGGNPLYAEEFVRMLRDRELIDERGVLRADADVPVPDSIHALIAARIDSLPPDRKDLLQDASVIGKVFWAGAAESMGSRDGGDVRSALHELARKELVRPSRQSSMEGEAEYTFWHALVRDVVYGQIPRARRAARHLAAADWLENKAGERLEDVADVLAYHTGEALELLESAGDRDQFPDVASRARRFALLAGERAREIDPLRAIEWYDRVLALTPEDDPDRALVLTRWAASVREAGRVGEAEPALSRALVLARGLGDSETLLRVLFARQELYVDEVNPAQATAADEIIAICDKLPPSALRLETLGEVAMQKMVNGEYATSIRIADEALALAEELDMRLPTRVLTARGGSRCSLGDDRGLADSRGALEREIAAGAGHRAAIAFNNLAIDTSLFDGIEAALAVLAKGETFASRRGLANALRTIRCGQSCYLGLAGRLGEAIRIADEIIPVATAAGDEWAAHEATIYRAFALSEQGRLEDPEALLTVVRRGNFIVDNLVVGAAAAAAQLVRVGDAARTRAVLDEVLDREDAADSAELALRLPVLVRAAVQSESLDTASALIDRVQPNTPIRQYALASSRAVLAEVRGAHDEAAGLFHEAVQGWRAAGGRLEEAHALLGYGRCLLSLGDSAAVDSLRAARTLFEEMGVTPRVVEADSLIERATSPV